MFLNFLWGVAYAASETVGAPYQRGGDGVLDMIRHAGPMVKFILLMLILLSIGCWCVTFVKARLYRRVQKESELFINYFRQRKSLAALYRDTQMLQYSHMAEIFRIGYAELNRLNKSVDAKNFQEAKVHPEELLESVDRAMRGAAFGAIPSPPCYYGKHRPLYRPVRHCLGYNDQLSGNWLERICQSCCSRPRHLRGADRYRHRIGRCYSRRCCLQLFH